MGFVVSIMLIYAGMCTIGFIRTMANEKCVPSNAESKKRFEDSVRRSRGF